MVSAYVQATRLAIVVLCKESTAHGLVEGKQHLVACQLHFPSEEVGMSLLWGLWGGGQGRK